MSETEPKRLIATVERATDVLTLFTRVERQDLGVTEIANELQLSKAVIHRVLNTLAAKGFIETDEETRRYRLGPAVLALGQAYVDRLDIRDLAQAYMRALSEQTNETATLSQRYRWERLYVDQITPEREVKMTVALGRRFRSSGRPVADPPTRVCGVGRRTAGGGIQRRRPDHRPSGHPHRRHQRVRPQGALYRGPGPSH
jgi:DNA-binding PadR family transcriptional regulator